MTVEELVTKTKMMLSGVQEQMKMAEITGTPPSDLPGAEHDKPIPEGAKDADPQVTDGSMGPTSAYTEGGEEQKNEPVGQLFEADEPVLNPEKKPEETADANAKTAGADELANSILNDIRQAQEQMKKAEIVADKDSQEVTKKPEESADANADAKDTDKGGTKETVTPDTTVADTTPEKDEDVNGEAKQAAELQLTTDLLAKLACYMLAEEEGAELGERVLAKIAGAEAASATMDFLEKKAAEAEYWSAWQKGAQAAEDLIGAAAAEAGAEDAAASEAAGAADAEALINDAAASDAAGAADAEALINDAAASEAAGAEDAESLLADDAGAEDDGVTPEEFVDALKSMVESGEITEDQAAEALQATGLSDAAQGEGSDEDVEIAQLASEIQSALDSGALTMDQAQALVEELSDDAGDDTISELKDDVVDGAADDTGDTSTDEKAASANDIMSLINKIRKLGKK